MITNKARFRNGVAAIKRQIERNPDFREVDELYREQDYRKAVFVAQDIVFSHPENAEAKYKLALALSRTNQIIRARSYLQEIVKQHGTNASADHRYQRALAVVNHKIEVAGRWVDEKLADSDARLERTLQGKDESTPEWLQLHEHSIRTNSTSDQIRNQAVLLKKMHLWEESAVLYAQLLNMGKCKEVDLLQYVKCLIRSGQFDQLASVLAEVNNIRSRERKSIYTMGELAATVNEYRYAVRDVDIHILEGSTDVKELEKIQIRLRNAGRIQDALHTGLIAGAMAPNARIELRNGLYAEQFGMGQVAIEEYNKAITHSADGPTLASLRMARLVGMANDEETSIRAILIGYGYWQEFDEDGELVERLTGLLEASPSKTDSAQPGNDFDVEEYRRQSSHRNDELKLQAEVPQRTVAAVAAENVRRSMVDDGYGLSVGVGAFASGHLRRHEAVRLLRIGDSASAILEARKIVYSATDFDTADFGFLAYVLARAGNYVEALAALTAGESNSDPFRFQAESADQRSKQVFRYLELRSQLSVSDDLFLWESHFGNRVDCNPYAMWQEAKTRRDSALDLHIWVCNDPKLAPIDVINDPNTVVTQRESAGYWLALAAAKYLVNNASFPFEYMKRTTQVHINTWHGTPLKALGRDDHDSPYDYGNVSRNLIHASDLILPNNFTAEIMMDRYCVASLSPAKVHVLGQARNDRIVNLSADERTEIRQQIGLSDSDKFVLYAPTWRGGSKSSWFDVDRLKTDLKKMSDDSRFVLGFRGHPLAMQHLQGLQFDGIIPEPRISTYDLLSVADVLVTDYSSLGVDFLSLERPVIYYVYDYEEYSSSRGLSIDIDEFPGHIVHDIDELGDLLTRAVNGTLASTKTLLGYREEYASLDDGSAAVRAVDTLFSNSEGKPGGSDESFAPARILLTHSLDNRDSLEEFIYTANDLSRRDVTVVVVFNHSALKRDRALVAVLDRLSSEILVLPRKGKLVATAAESIANRGFYDQDEFASPDAEELYARAMRREAARLFGECHFSLALSWGIDDTLLTSLCAYGVEAEVRAAYINSDIVAPAAKYAASKMRSLKMFPKFDSIYVTTQESCDWIRSQCEVKGVELVGRVHLLPAGELQDSSSVPLGSTLVVGADTDILVLEAAVDHVLGADQAQQVGDGAISVFVQGPARGPVAEIIRSKFTESSIDVITEDLPYSAIGSVSRVVDCSSDSGPSVVELAARESNVPVFRPFSINNSDGERCDSAEFRFGVRNENNPPSMLNHGSDVGAAARPLDLVSTVAQCIERLSL